ncbi:MAG TPA: FAD-binding protein, partial [Clostridia bacterium]|nr:FAD-binding protein [Clostridia bacterium]
CVMEKGHIKRSGSVTMGMDALNVVVVPGISTPLDYVRAVREKTWGIMDFLPNYTLAQRSFEILKLLEEWGVFFPKDAEGNYKVVQVDDGGKFCVCMDEPDLKPMLEKKVREAGVKVLNKTMATKLVVQDGKVLGAVGFNLTDGRVFFCQAKSVILANGSAGRFGLPNTGYLYGTYDFPGNAGDGFALAFRAGARITGMEYTLKYVLVKDLNMPLIYIVIPRGGQIINAAGEVIIDQHNLSVFRLREALENGEGPFFLKTDHLPKEKIMEIESILFSTERPMQRRYWELKGIKLGRDSIELDLTEAQLCGGHGISGIVINEKAETNVQGLFAAGDVSSVPMQHLTGALVYGQIAAESAVRYCAGQKANRFNRALESSFNQELQRLGSLLNSVQGNKIPVSAFEYKVRRIINEYLLSPKNASYLSKGLELISSLGEQLPHLVCANTYHEFSKVLEAEFILDCARMSAVASLTRQESRWGNIHYRTDYPERDDLNWLKHIDLQKGSDDSEIMVSLREIQRGEME